MLLHAEQHAGWGSKFCISAATSGQLLLGLSMLMHAKSNACCCQLLEFNAAEQVADDLLCLGCMRLAAHRPTWLT